MGNPNERRIILCKGCKQQKPYHAKDMCLNCYRKLAWKREKIVCKNCGKERYHKAFGLCAGCHIKLYHYDKTKEHNYRKNHNITVELYRSLTEKCTLCGFDKVVELHHFDRNHSNNSADNLIGLCPNHHRMIHDGRYREEVLKEIEGKRCKKS
jgi:ribosomal protein L37E